MKTPLEANYFLNLFRYIDKVLARCTKGYMSRSFGQSQSHICDVCSDQYL